MQRTGLGVEKGRGSKPPSNGVQGQRHGPGFGRLVGRSPALPGGAPPNTSAFGPVFRRDVPARRGRIHCDLRLATACNEPTTRVSSLLYSLGILVTLIGMLFWARRRASVIRERSAAREQEAMAMLLAAGSRPQEEPDAQAPPDALPKPIGRLLDDDASEKAAAAAREAARIAKEEGRVKDLPPLELHEQPRAPTPAEQAAAGLDPIEELISQIMIDPPHARKPVPARPRAAERRPAAPAPVESAPRPDAIGFGVPLRELALAWYESRGYRGSPASPAVWPIELVLRHRDDAARAYAFVVQNDHISVDRITALIEQAREIGMLRVAVVAEAGYEQGAKEVARKRNVRLIDRSTMDAELAALELPTAAKIIAVARKRASAEASPASSSA